MIFEAIRHIFLLTDLKGALGAQQFILQSSCGLSKSTLSTNTSIAFSSESLRYGLQRLNGGHRGHVAGQRIPRVMHVNGGRFQI